MRVHLPFEGGGKQAADHAREHTVFSDQALAFCQSLDGLLELGVVERLLFSTFLSFSWGKFLNGLSNYP
ncbi:MAG: hypothetical protein IPI95_09455 [Flavobacteriales bacterium]|nr:hypothetical protein [Flavobacteriales bacterium]